MTKAVLLIGFSALGTCCSAGVRPFPLPITLCPGLKSQLLLSRSSQTPEKTQKSSARRKSKQKPLNRPGQRGDQGINPFSLELCSSGCSHGNNSISVSREHFRNMNPGAQLLKSETPEVEPSNLCFSKPSSLRSPMKCENCGVMGGGGGNRADFLPWGLQRSSGLAEEGQARAQDPPCYLQLVSQLNIRSGVCLIILESSLY